MVRRPIENIEFEEISVCEVERLIEKLCVVLCIESALIAQFLSTEPSTANSLCMGAAPQLWL